jgi:hypothetical protein
MKHDENAAQWIVTRRDFLRVSTTALAGLSFTHPVSSYAETPPIRFGIVTDCHFADREPLGTRHYRESLDKLGECVKLMNEKKVSFLLECGDFKDQNDKPKEEDTLAFLRRVESAFKEFQGPRYHVLGNHDMDSISKAQFQAEVENTGIAKDRTYYSFDSGGLHCVVLDACYTADGLDYDHGKFSWQDSNIPASQIDWLKKDLTAAKSPVIVFVHQRLDGKGNLYVANAEAVRTAIEESKKVLAVFQGHDHPGGYNMINGVHYYTLCAVVEGTGMENGSYAVVDVDAAANITITGYRKAVSKNLAHAGTV